MSFGSLLVEGIPFTFLAYFVLWVHRCVNNPGTRNNAVHHVILRSNKAFLN